VLRRVIAEQARQRAVSSTVLAVSPTKASSPVGQHSRCDDDYLLHLPPGRRPCGSPDRPGREDRVVRGSSLPASLETGGRRGRDSSVDPTIADLCPPSWANWALGLLGCAASPSGCTLHTSHVSPPTQATNGIRAFASRRNPHNTCTLSRATWGCETTAVARSVQILRLFPTMPLLARRRSRARKDGDCPSRPPAVLVRSTARRFFPPGPPLTARHVWRVSRVCGGMGLWGGSAPALAGSVDSAASGLAGVSRTLLRVQGRSTTALGFFLGPLQLPSMAVGVCGTWPSRGVPTDRVIPRFSAPPANRIGSQPFEPTSQPPWSGLIIQPTRGTWANHASLHASHAPGAVIPSVRSTSETSEEPRRLRLLVVRRRQSPSDSMPRWRGWVYLAASSVVVAWHACDNGYLGSWDARGILSRPEPRTVYRGQPVYKVKRRGDVALPRPVRPSGQFAVIE